MKRAAWHRWTFLGAGLLVAGLAVWELERTTALGRASTWERQARSGELTAAHQFLADNCAACHTPNKGPDPARCAACHANDQALLTCQSTAFHATVTNCRECHPEHQGAAPPPSRMDHAAFARIGLRELKADDRAAADRIAGWVKGHREASVEETLDCRACHSARDRHQGLFGPNCVDCHATDRWSVAGYQHPPPTSTDCVQCHRAPPSHYMMHFHMVSMHIAGKHHADVRQCQECHLPTAWNDIRGVGWYKHH